MRMFLSMVAVLLSAMQGAAANSALNHWIIQPPANGVYTGVTGGVNSDEGSCRGVSSAAGVTMQFCVDNQRNIENFESIVTDSRVSDMSAAGSVPLVALGCNGDGTPDSGGRTTFSQIAAGARDAQLAQAVAAMKAYAARFPKFPWVMIRPFHEFNVNIGNPRNHPNRNNCYSMPESIGQMQSEFVAAYRHVVTYFIQNGAKNVTWLWCPAVGPLVWRNYGGDLSGFYPGDQYVDWTCADAYNRGGVGAATTFAHLDFFRQFHKPLIIAETGSCNGDRVSRKCGESRESQAAFINEIAQALRPGGQLADDGVKAWLYFDQDVPSSGFNWSFDHAGMAAFRQLLSDPYFHAAMPPPRFGSSQ